MQPYLNSLIVESRFINRRGIWTEKVKPFASESFNRFGYLDHLNRFGYFGHCAQISKLVYYIYFSSLVNLLIL